MAIARDVGLEGVVEAGTRLNADISAELLKTIFWPGSALHDMGLVIRGDKAIAAGVQFPLAEGADISQELGSRHRAALGLSQEADCLVVVVSEETGAVSLAERGQLLRKLSVDGLRAMLRRGLAQPAAEEKRRRERSGKSSRRGPPTAEQERGVRPPRSAGAAERINRIRPMVWKRRIEDYALVTLITVLIWLYAESQNVQQYRPDGMVPLAVRVASNDLVVTKQTDTRLQLEFRGAQAELDRLPRRLADGLELELNLAEPGEHEIRLASELYRTKQLAGASVNLTRVQPETVKVTVARMVERPVELTFAPREVQIVPESLRINPPEATVRLPEGKLDALNGAGAAGGVARVSVESRVDLKGLSAGVEHRVKARVALPAALADDPQVSVTPPEVTVTFTIDKKEATATLPTVPVWVSMPPDEVRSFTVDLLPDSRVLRDVKVTGPPALIEKVKSQELRVVAMLMLSRDELVQGVGKESSKTVRFEAPAGVSVVTPVATVRFTIDRPTP